MSSQDDKKIEETATAAKSGAAATARFESDKHASVNTPKERVSKLASSVLEAVHQTIINEKVTYDEYNALKSWLIEVGKDGEWPLFLDVWIEHWVEEVATEHREGNKGTIEGPYYVPNAPVVSNGNGVATVPMRDDEPGVDLVWNGTVTDVQGNPLKDGKIEIWHADDFGFYSQYAPGLPEWNLRGTVETGADGSFEIHTKRPAPYQIPTDGACGKLIAAAGWHAWRPAHIHVKVSAPGYELLTAQLYFPGDKHNDDDIAQAVKPELILNPQKAGDHETVDYSFKLDKEHAA